MLFICQYGNIGWRSRERDFYGLEMRLQKSLKAVLILSVLGGVSACSTVDLSQMAMEKPAVQVQAQKQSVVERASVKMTELFAKNRWSAPKAQSAGKTAMILLHGLSKTKDSDEYKAASRQDFLNDINAASMLMNQASKAAEIYLAMVVDNSELEKELLYLEQALIAAKQANMRFAKEAKRHNMVDEKTGGKLSAYRLELDRLQSVTDNFGVRVRQFVNTSISADKS